MNSECNAHSLQEQVKQIRALFSAAAAYISTLCPFVNAAVIGLASEMTAQNSFKPQCNSTVSLKIEWLPFSGLSGSLCHGKTIDGKIKNNDIFETARLAKGWKNSTNQLLRVKSTI